MRIPGQVLAYAAFGAALVLLSGWPAYRPLAEHGALLLVSLAHPSRPVGPCRRLNGIELAARAPNMRAPEECPRRRVAVPIAVELDGRMLVDETLAPSGLAQDGTASIYRRIPVAAGSHTLRVRLLDEERFAAITLSPGQVVRIDYRLERGGVLIL